jgi:hypothetical protein
MAKATDAAGNLNTIRKCVIKIPKIGQILMDNLPDISDSKSASYTDEVAIGRSSPFKNYSHSDNRTIAWTCHFIIQQAGDDERFLEYLRMLEACTYPFINDTGGAPYAPPPICQIQCGRLLGENPLCAILKSYSVKFDTSVPWAENSLMPYKTDVDLQFDVVYNQSELPGADTIMDL